MGDSLFICLFGRVLCGLGVHLSPCADRNRKDIIKRAKHNSTLYSRNCGREGYGAGGARRVLFIIELQKYRLSWRFAIIVVQVAK